jgi:hypothetical protein
MLVNMINFYAVWFSRLLAEDVNMGGTGCCSLKLSLYAEICRTKLVKGIVRNLNNHEGSMDPYDLTSEWLYDLSVCPDLPFGDI